MEYSRLTKAYEELEKTSSRLSKTDIIAGLLSETEPELLTKVALLIQGRVFPSWSEEEMGIASKLMLKIIANSTGTALDKVTSLFRKIGDFGLIVEKLLENKKQQTLFRKTLTVEMVFDNIQKLAGLEGKKSQERKFNLVSEILGSAKSNEGKYVVRTILGDLRVGVAQGVIRDAIAKAFFADILWTGSDWKNERMFELIRNSKGGRFVVEKGFLDRLVEKGRVEQKEVSAFKSKNDVTEKTVEAIEKMGDKELWRAKSKLDYVFLADEKVGGAMKNGIVSTIEWAWFLRPDYGETAKVAKEGGLAGLRNVKIHVGSPVYVHLAEKAPDLENALKSFESVAVETKYDGMRTQVHVKGDDIWLYTRRLENVTKQFPDLVKLVKQCVKSRDCVIEGETLGLDPKTGKTRPFQDLSQRIQRKYDIEKLMKEIPIQIFLFDLIYADGRDYFKEPLKARREKLRSIVKILPDKFELTNLLVTHDIKAAEKFYKDSLQANQEGVMVKNLDAWYQPGRRVAGGWLKVKPTMENLDLAIIGATWGTGKRAGWLSSFILGCRAKDNGDFVECGMMGTGIKEKDESGMSFRKLTEMLKPHITSEKGSEVRVAPRIVVEIAYEEIQKSPNYKSGYALRFPRLVRIRDDKSVREADTVKRVEELYRQQKGGRQSDAVK